MTPSLKYIFIMYLFIVTALQFSAVAKKYSYEVGDETTSTVTKESFHRIFYEIYGLYATELAQFRIPVVPIAQWENPYFSAYTAEVNGVMKMGFWGGMARVPGMNDDAVALITCHEVGHLLGGAPYIAINLPTYEDVSSEGQADYFTTKECLKKYFEGQRNTIDYLALPRTSEEDQLCSYLEVSDWDEALCVRVAKAIGGFSHVLKLLKEEEGGPFSLTGHDDQEVDETLFNSYPSNQCRINTFTAGLFDQPRPRCWYNPVAH